MDEQRRVMHPLSQVRFGVSLTKVLFPTVTLEKSPLLETSAPVLAHLDLLLDRRLPGARWSGGTAQPFMQEAEDQLPRSRAASFGVRFLCPGALPEENTELVWEGPVPCNSAAFVAEQESHHPPSSAFHLSVLTRRCNSASIYGPDKTFLGC